jgi:site-specific DNA-cytosine methylase
VVGTSNLSDGNVLLGDGQPRSGKRGKVKNHGTPQGQRTTSADASAPTITRHLHHTIVDPTGNLDSPSATVTAKPSRKGAGAHSVFTLHPERGQTLSNADAPAPTIVRNTHGNASILTGFGTLNPKHPPTDPDQPSSTVGAKPRGNGASVISTTSKHPVSSSDEPAMTVRAFDGEGANRALEWPWDRPSTTVLADERISPPGHHDEDYRIMSVDGDGIVISERAAALLQGFPDGWVFVGSSKKQRWSQIGQAMPPPLAHAVASSVVVQIAKTPAEEAPALLSVVKGGA